MKLERTPSELRENQVLTSCGIHRTKSEQRNKAKRKPWNCWKMLVFINNILLTNRERSERDNSNELRMKWEKRQAIAAWRFSAMVVIALVFYSISLYTKLFIRCELVSYYPLPVGANRGVSYNSRNLHISFIFSFCLPSMLASFMIF